MPLVHHVSIVHSPLHYKTVYPVNSTQEGLKGNSAVLWYSWIHWAKPICLGGYPWTENSYCTNSPIAENRVMCIQLGLDSSTGWSELKKSPLVSRGDIIQYLLHVLYNSRSEVQVTLGGCCAHLCFRKLGLLESLLPHQTTSSVSQLKNRTRSSRNERCISQSNRATQIHLNTWFTVKGETGVCTSGSNNSSVENPVIVPNRFWPPGGLSSSFTNTARVGGDANSTGDYYEAGSTPTYHVIYIKQSYSSWGFSTEDSSLILTSKLILAIAKWANWCYYIFSNIFNTQSSRWSQCLNSKLQGYWRCTNSFIPLRQHNPVTSSSIARWLKPTMNNAGIDISIFKSHSVHETACSKAGVTTKQILEAADWSLEGTFQKYYHRSLDGDD